jgi:NADPH2:quinone reductase
MDWPSVAQGGIDRRARIVRRCAALASPHGAGAAWRKRSILRPMKAIAYTQTGAAADVLKLIELPTPEPGAGEVRVRLRWSGVNPSDVKSRAGLRSKVLPFPQIVPHSDGAGEIDAVGAGVNASRVGERVWVWNGQWQRPFGTAAQHIVLPAAQAVPLPDSVSGEAGACLGIPALTALHAVLTGCCVAGQRVLVAGGAGAVGHYAVQFARKLGAAQVVATVSSDAKAELASAAGADHTIDYKRDNVGERVMAATGKAGVDAVVEMDLAANAKLYPAALRPRGHVVVYGTGSAEATIPAQPCLVNAFKIEFVYVYELTAAERTAAISAINRMLQSKTLTSNVALARPLDDVAAAHEAVEQGRTMGNVVITL